MLTWGGRLMASLVLCVPALMAVTWRQARPRARSTSGVCCRGRWRRCFRSSTGEMRPVSPSGHERVLQPHPRGHVLFRQGPELAPRGQCPLTCSAVSQVRERSCRSVQPTAVCWWFLLQNVPFRASEWRPLEKGSGKRSPIFPRLLFDPSTPAPLLVRMQTRFLRPHLSASRAVTYPCSSVSGPEALNWLRAVPSGTLSKAWPLPFQNRVWKSVWGSSELPRACQRVGARGRGEPAASSSGAWGALAGGSRAFPPLPLKRAGQRGGMGPLRLPRRQCGQRQQGCAVVRVLTSPREPS